MTQSSGPRTLEEWAQYGIGEPEDWVDGVPLYADYRVPEGTTRRIVQEGDSVGWAEILTHWNLIVPDLAAVYGVDLHDPALEGRSWLWLRGLILGLLNRDSSLSRALAPK